MNKVYLGLGGNLGDRATFLKKAIENLGELGKITGSSSIIETPAWGITDVPHYLNMAVLLETNLFPLALIAEILKIEQSLGRQRVQKWGSRVIDIDILFYNDWVISTEGLNIPHPFIVDRMFVLQPLMELNSEFEHPVSRKKISQLYQKLKNETSN